MATTSSFTTSTITTAATSSSPATSTITTTATSSSPTTSTSAIAAAPPSTTTTATAASTITTTAASSSTATSTITTLAPSSSTTTSTIATTGAPSSTTSTTGAPSSTTTSTITTPAPSSFTTTSTITTATASSSTASSTITTLSASSSTNSSTITTAAALSSPTTSTITTAVASPSTTTSTATTAAVLTSPTITTATVSPSTTTTSTISIATASKPRLSGIVFDMDGTLTVPVIDFQAMHKAVLGEDQYVALKSKNPTGIDILRHIENWSPDEQKKAYDTIVDYERQGLDRLQIMPGASDLCSFLNSRNIRMGLITCNFKESVDFFHQRFGMVFCPAVSREFGTCKPDPAPLLHICATWGIPPNEVMMIGDSLKHDVGCGKRAGAYTCLLDQTGKYDAAEFADFDFKPDYKVSSLAEVHSILDENFDLAPSSCCDPPISP